MVDLNTIARVPDLFRQGLVDVRHALDLSELHLDWPHLSASFDQCHDLFLGPFAAVDLGFDLWIVFQELLVLGIPINE